MTHPLPIASALTFSVSLILFLVNAAQRRRIRGNAAALIEPEKRWTYDQRLVIEFIEALHRSSGTGGRGPGTGLDDYRLRVLPLDILFALTFSLFIVLASLFLAHSPGASPWITDAGTTIAGLGVLYGACDIGEDVKLIQILWHAERVLPHRAHTVADPDATALADAAQVDAANVLTRLKFVTFWTSLIGLITLLALLRFTPQ